MTKTHRAKQETTKDELVGSMA